MRTVGTFDAKTHFSQLVSEVEQTRQAVVIQRRGKNVAALVPYQDLASRSARARGDWILGELAAIRARQRKPRPGETIEELIEEGRER